MHQDHTQKMFAKPDSLADRHTSHALRPRTV